MKELVSLLRKTNRSDKIINHKEMINRQIERYNNTEGYLHLEDGIECSDCKNKGYIMCLNSDEDDICMTICECNKRREAVRRTSLRLGENLSKRPTDYKIYYDWQRKNLSKMINFLKKHSQDNVWFAALGTFGCGKTLMCCIIANYLLYKEKRVVAYVEWTELMNDINLLAASKDYSLIREKVDYLKNVDVLYLDDLIKDYNSKLSDKRYAFEILNHRYLNNFKTIISSQYTISELLNIDEAIFSRVIQKCETNIVNEGHDRNKNLRLVKLLQGE